MGIGSFSGCFFLLTVGFFIHWRFMVVIGLRNFYFPFSFACRLLDVNDPMAFWCADALISTAQHLWPLHAATSFIDRLTAPANRIYPAHSKSSRKRSRRFEIIPETCRGQLDRTSTLFRYWLVDDQGKEWTGLVEINFVGDIDRCMLPSYFHYGRLKMTLGIGRCDWLLALLIRTQGHSGREGCDRGWGWFSRRDVTSE